MGKKAKSTKGAQRAQARKVDKSTLPPPPKPVTDELGSAKLLDAPSLPGTGYKALDAEGYDDGGVADLTLVIDLDDSVLRRKRGETEYFQALKADLLPRVTKGPYAPYPRREQKIRLAKLLFSDDETENENPSEVYQEPVAGDEDPEAKKLKLERLGQARMALNLSNVLREPACASLSLSEISKRRLAAFGKEGAEAALRCADKAIEIAGPGFWDRDEIEIECMDNPTIDENYEKNATCPGLSHESTLKLQPIRVAELCFRSAYLHRGNALSALGREDEARETYLKVMPYLEKEPRCGRLDFERCSILVNVGNTYSRQGDYEKADEYYQKAEKLGRDHLEVEEGNKIEGTGIIITAMRARAFALKKSGREDEGKKVLKEVIAKQLELNALNEKKKAEEKALEEAQMKEAEKAALAQQAASNPAATTEVQ